MRYTIVLTPPSDQATKYIEASQTLFKEHKNSYLLANDGTSFPHITIIQFDCESADLADVVWLGMCAKMREKIFTPFSPVFIGMSFVRDSSCSHEHITWVELSVKKGEEDSPLMQLHYAALAVLKHFKLKPLNASGNNYRPHLTLARIVMPEQIRSWSEDLYDSPGNFNLAFGLSDDKWQYAKTLKVFP